MQRVNEGRQWSCFSACHHIYWSDNINLSLTWLFKTERRNGGFFLQGWHELTQVSCGMLGSITFASVNETASLILTSFPLRASERDVVASIVCISPPLFFASLENTRGVWISKSRRRERHNYQHLGEFLYKFNSFMYTGNWYVNFVNR